MRCFFLIILAIISIQFVIIYGKVKSCFSGTSNKAVQTSCPRNLSDACLKTEVQTPTVRRVLYGCTTRAACNRKKSIVYKSNDVNSILFDCCYRDNCFTPEYLTEEYMITSSANYLFDSNYYIILLGICINSILSFTILI